MKKFTLLAILLVGISTTSCKKDRTCNCTDTLTENIVGGPDAGTYSTSQAYTTTYNDANASTARANCLSYNFTDAPYQDGAGGTITDTYSTKCTLD